MDHLQVLQNNAARVILDLPRFNLSASKALDQLNWKPLFLRRKHRRCIAAYKCLNDLIDYDFNILTKNSDIHNYKMRGRDELRLPSARTNWGKQRLSTVHSRTGIYWTLILNLSVATIVSNPD